jgi:hypothetical protein
MWKVFAKAGHPGWAAIIPIYNMYVWCKIVGRPGWWVILMLIPLVNIVVAIIVCIDMAKSFGKGAGFGIGLALLGIIFLPILGLAVPSIKDQRLRKERRFLNRRKWLRKALCLGRVSHSERSYATQFGLRFSLKAAMPSLASADSRASR